MLLSMSTVNSVARFFTVFIIFIFVLFVTYYTTRWIASYQKKKQSGGYGNIQVMETFQVAQNKYVQIIRLGDKYVAIAVSKDAVTMLTEIPPDSLVFKEEQGEAKTLDFKEIFEKIKNKKPGDFGVKKRTDEKDEQ